MAVSITRAMRAGAARFEAELMKTAASAIRRFFFSEESSGESAANADLSVCFFSCSPDVVSAYFMMLYGLIGLSAFLGIKYLHVFGSRMHEFLMRACSENFPLHEHDDLVIAFNWSYFLRN